MESRIENVINGFDFKKRSGSIWFWKNTTPGNSWSLEFTNQPWRTNKGQISSLQNYRSNCLRYGEVGPGTWRQHDCIAGEAADKLRPIQRTKDSDSFLGQLAVPVYNNRILVGVIELITHVPKKDYSLDVDQIRHLVKAENLHT